MLEVMQSGNLLLRFVLEVAMLAVLGVAAWRGPNPRWARAVAAAATVAGVSAIWALVVHGPLPAVVRIGTEVLLFGAAGVAVAGAGRRAAAAAFVALVLANAGLMAVWGQ